MLYIGTQKYLAILFYHINLPKRKKNGINWKSNIKKKLRRYLVH